MKRLTLLSLLILLSIAPPASAQFLFWGGNNVNQNLGALFAFGEYQRSRYQVQEQQMLQQQWLMQSQMMNNYYQPRYGGYGGWNAPWGYPASYAPQPSPVADQLAKDRMLCWEVFGATFVPANAAEVRAVDSRFQGGMAVAAIRTGGPSDIAGWENSDVLVGLYKYRITSYDNLSYVAELPELGAVSPIRTVMIRGDKVIEGKIDVLKGLTSSPTTTTDSGDAMAAQWTMPASAKASVPRELSAGPPLNGSLADEKILWNSLGIQGHGTSINRPGIQFDKGVTISAVKPGSFAQQAGWHGGEQIVGLAGYQIRTVEDLAYVLKNLGSARSVEFMTVSSGGVTQGRVSVSPVSDSSSSPSKSTTVDANEVPVPVEPSFEEPKK